MFHGLLSPRHNARGIQLLITIHNFRLYERPIVDLVLGFDTKRFIAHYMHNRVQSDIL